MYFFLDNEPKLIVANPRLFLYGCLRWHLYIPLNRDSLHLLHLFRKPLLTSADKHRLRLTFDDLIEIHPRHRHIDHYSVTEGVRLLPRFSEESSK